MIKVVMKLGAVAAITITLTGALVLGPESRTVAGAPVADVERLTANDREFIAATDRVIMGFYDGSDEMRWIGYPDVPAQLRINTAYGVCDMLDDGPAYNAIPDFIVGALDDDREHAGYLAAWFQQSAIVHYCPRHSDKLSNI